MEVSKVYYNMAMPIVDLASVTCKYDMEFCSEHDKLSSVKAPPDMPNYSHTSHACPQGDLAQTLNLRHLSQKAAVVSHVQRKMGKVNKKLLMTLAFLMVLSAKHGRRHILSSIIRTRSYSSTWGYMGKIL